MDIRLTKYYFFWFYTNSSLCSYELQLHMELSQNSSCTPVPIAHIKVLHISAIPFFWRTWRFRVRGYNMCVQYFTVILRCKGKCSIYWLLCWLNNVEWAQVGYLQFKMQRPGQVGPIWVLSKCVCLPVAQSIVALGWVFTIHPTTNQHISNRAWNEGYLKVREG